MIYSTPACTKPQRCRAKPAQGMALRSAIEGGEEKVLHGKFEFLCQNIGRNNRSKY
jgi:hypothetical protein